MYRGKISKKIVEQFVFRLFWILTRKYFCRKVFARVVKNTFDLSSGTLTEQHFRMKSWKLEDFRINFGVFGTMAENLFQCWQNSNGCPREHFMRNFFQKRKIRFFSDSVRLFTCSEIFRQSCETRNLCIRGSFWGKTVFEINIIFHTFFGLWSKERLVGKRLFYRVVTTAIGEFQRQFLRKSIFLKKSFVCSSVLEFEHFFLSIDKK